MIKSEELINQDSCLNKAKDGEFLFVLLGRDAAAPAVINFWVSERIRLGKNNWYDNQIQEALTIAARMEFNRKSL